MDNMEELNKVKFITVVGRSPNMDKFVKELKRNLFDNFNIVAVHGLGEFGIDDKERFLAFITGDSEVGHTFDAQEEKFRDAKNKEGIQYFGARTHLGIEAAFDYSRENFPAFGEIEVEKQRKFEELKEKFPPVSASETEFFSIFEALFNTGKYHVIRCTLDEYPCLAV